MEEKKRERERETHYFDPIPGEVGARAVRCTVCFVCLYIWVPTVQLLLTLVGLGWKLVDPGAGKLQLDSSCQVFLARQLDR